MGLEEAHDCPECHNKIVCISVDELGNTYCGYCHKQVDYKSYYKINKNLEFNKFLKRVKDEMSSLQ